VTAYLLPFAALMLVSGTPKVAPSSGSIATVTPPPNGPRNAPP
jgi:hypothetical protein